MSNERYSTNPDHYKQIVRRKDKEPLIERLDYCRAMLHMQGFLGDGENERVQSRLARIRRMVGARWTRKRASKFLADLGIVE